MTAEGGSSYQSLRASKTLQEILEVATSFEQTARDFYRDLAPQVGKNIRWLVEELAEEEQRHYDLFSELAERPDLADQLDAMVEVPASDTRFSDMAHRAQLSERPDDQEILQFALGREHAAMEQYTALAHSAPEGPFRDLFRYLANEETQHKTELEKLYYEVVHSGGV
jgi:rubrerythrin